MKKRIVLPLVALLMMLAMFPVAHAESEFTLIVPHRYHEVRPFSEGRGEVRLNAKWGYVDDKGIEVIAPIYDEVTAFSEGLAAVSLDGKWGYIDKNGNIAIPFRECRYLPFSEGLAVFSAGEKGSEKFGFVDKTGKEIIPPTYDNVNSFSEGMAAFYIGDVPQATGKWGFLDKNGNEIIGAKYDGIDFEIGFSGGFARVYVGNTWLGDGKWGIIDKAGNEIIPPDKYDSIGRFYDGLAFASRAGKCGFVDTAGKEIIPFQYTYATDFSDGIAAVQKTVGETNGFVFIDKTGNEKFESMYGWVNQYHDGVLHVVKMGGGGWGLLDLSGKEIVAPGKYNSISEFSEGYAAVAKASPEYQSIGSVERAKYGFIDRFGNEVILPNYDAVQAFSEGIAAVCLNQRWGFIKISDTPAPWSPWAGAEVNAALAISILPDSVAQSGWTEQTSRLSAAEMVVRLIEKAMDQTMDQLAAENGWDLSTGGFADTDNQYVTFLKHAGIANGLDDVNYGPNSVFTRAQFVTMIGRASEVFFGETARGDNPFTDVPVWAAPYVGYAVDKGITNGISDELFLSGGVLTNQQTAVFGYRTFSTWQELAAPALSINNTKVISVQSYYRMIMGGVRSECKSRSCITELYRFITDSLIQEIERPEHLNEYSHLGVWDGFNREISFMETEGLDGTAIRQYHIFQLSDTGSVVNGDGFTVAEVTGRGDWAIHDVTSDKWYYIDNENLQFDLSNIYDTGIWEIILDNVV